MSKRLLAKLGNLGARIRERGWGEAFKYPTYRLHEEFHERRFGIKTTGLVTEEQIGHQSPDFLSYSGAPYRALFHCLGLVHVEPGRDVLLDIGSGMGRAMVVAATRPYKKVIGVEISPELAAKARDNLRLARARLKAEVEVVIGDARAYAIPHEVTAIHLFNPFVGATLTQVIGNIRRSLKEWPRTLSLVFGNPGRFEEMHLHEGWLVRRFAGSYYPGIGYAVYFSTPTERL